MISRVDDLYVPVVGQFVQCRVVALATVVFHYFGAGASATGFSARQAATAPEMYLLYSSRFITTDRTMSLRIKLPDVCTQMAQRHGLRHDVEGPAVGSFRVVGEVYDGLEKLQVRTVLVQRQKLRPRCHGYAGEELVSVVFALKQNKKVC